MSKVWVLINDKNTRQKRASVLQGSLDNVLVLQKR